MHWLKGFGSSRAAVLEAFADQVKRLGHVDNWFTWELSFSHEAGVEVREPGDVDLPRVRALWATEQSWERAAWASVNEHLGLGGPRAVALAPVLRNEREDVSALSREPQRALLSSLTQALATPLPESWPDILRENVKTQRREALAMLEGRDLSTPFLRELAPDDWPAHLVREPADGPVHYLAIDMHH